MSAKIYKLLFFGYACILGSSSIFGQCANTSNIYSFTYNGKTYEIIKEKKTWVNAAACAVERGGYLAEINDAAEQTAIFNQLNTNAGITTSNTTAPDGGGAAYAWIGGNDMATEGMWIWDGNNDAVGTQFWQGTKTGSPVGGLYNNWGNEPDNFGTNGQDGLAIALTNWPLGVAGQWNDVNDGNMLYYVVEHNINASTLDNLINDKIKVYPNPVTDLLRIDENDAVINNIIIYAANGKLVKTINKEQLKTNNNSIDLTNFEHGVYFLKLVFDNEESITKKIIR
ncbi:T9SS type A sorting domain-containing protein [Myroides sp. JBRI-B21084]|uniref:T9SS type A sorting domain-containing protein n=1 Tax=Myroides sp. JBRI-B21084 TaxID=3119977 RepID=UPI0026E44135|nr:T9SS type A sorting domain-containing protein [Paenimyroides cloacae]WKW47183.1 T9SS type A sorting domain-containing protein [Paenimyroides cloacae]